MAYNPTYDLLGQKVSDTYHWLVQSGSDGFLYDGDGNTLDLDPFVQVAFRTGSFTGSFSGIFTGSFTGSFEGIHTGSFTGSYSGSLEGTSSYAVTASYALTASYIENLYTGSYTGSFTGSFTGSLSGSLEGTSSYAVTSSYALTASYIENLYTGSYTGSFEGRLQITEPIRYTLQLLPQPLETVGGINVTINPTEVVNIFDTGQITGSIQGYNMAHLQYTLTTPQPDFTGVRAGEIRVALSISSSGQGIVKFTDVTTEDIGDYLQNVDISVVDYDGSKLTIDYGNQGLNPVDIYFRYKLLLI